MNRRRNLWVDFRIDGPWRTYGGCVHHPQLAQTQKVAFAAIMSVLAGNVAFIPYMIKRKDPAAAFIADEAATLPRFRHRF
jgi:hypothetical protein